MDNRWAPTPSAAPDGDHAPTGCLSCLPAKPACRLWRLTYEPAPRRAGLSAA
jgi:hypothetical protein